jgi:AcrR family transcriptional regulator
MSDPGAIDEPSPATTGGSARVDGRRAWRERNRLAVVDALLDLYAEGKLRPDANEVAERSGVSRRSVFRYFDDRDDLDRTAFERQQERVHHLLDIPGIGEGALDERILRVATQRLALFEQIGPAARVARLRAPFHRVIREQLEESRRFFIRQVERQFELELAGMDKAARSETLAAADALCSFETYDLLAGRGMASAEIVATLRRALTALFRAAK